MKPALVLLFVLGVSAFRLPLDDEEIERWHNESSRRELSHGLSHNGLASVHGCDHYCDFMCDGSCDGYFSSLCDNSCDSWCDEGCDSNCTG